jgi:hypothetical protein
MCDLAGEMDNYSAMLDGSSELYKCLLYLAEGLLLDICDMSALARNRGGLSSSSETVRTRLPSIPPPPTIQSSLELHAQFSHTT